MIHLRLHAPVLRRPPAHWERSRVLAAMNAIMAVNAFGGAWYALSGAPDVPTAWLAATAFET